MVRRRPRVQIPLAAYSEESHAVMVWLFLSNRKIFLFDKKVLLGSILVRCEEISFAILYFINFEDVIEQIFFDQSSEERETFVNVAIWYVKTL